MVNHNPPSGKEAVEIAQAAAKTDTLGPGTAGYTSSGAAYRGKEIAATLGLPGPAEVGFASNNGLGYQDVERPSDYEKAQPT